MKKFFYSALDAEPGEGRQVMYLLVLGFLLGVFVSTYDVSTSAVFLNLFNADEYLSIAIAVSGFLGLILTLIYSRAQKLIPYSQLAVISQLVITTIVCILTAGIFIGHNNEVLVFTSFVLLGPLNALALLNFWGVFNRLFNSRQAKRLSGGIDTGQVIATILGFFSIPIIQKVIQKEEDFLFFSSASLIVSLVVLIFLLKKFDLHSNVLNIQTPGRLKSTFFATFKNRYVLLMALFVIVSMMISELVDFSFLSVIERKYQDDQKNMAEFLAYYTGSIMIVGFIIQAFFDDRIIEMFGIKISLLIMPILLITFAVAAIVAGYTFGYSREAENFGVFFIVIAVIKLITESLKDSLEGRVFKIFYMPLSPAMMLDSQTKIEGVVTQFAGLLAGGIIISFNFIHFFDILHYQLILIGLAIIYIYYSASLSSEYKQSLHQTLAAGKTSGNKKKEIFMMLPEEVNDENLKYLIASLSALEKKDPMRFQMMGNKLFKLNHPVITDLLRSKLFTEDPNQRNLEFEEAVALTGSPGFRDRIKAAWALADYPEESGKILLKLLKDDSSAVKLAAILAAGKSKNKTLIPALIENLSGDITGQAAIAALAEYKEEILNVLENAFYRSDQHIKTMTGILEIYGKIGGETAIDFLWNKISYPDKSISNKALHELAKLNYQTSRERAVTIKTAIDDCIYNLVWNYAAIQEIQTADTSSGKLVAKALIKENEENYEFLFLLLSMIYDKHSVAMVKENIRTGISEKIGYALEMLDVFIAEDQKPKLIPILNDISDADKVRKLSNIFPRSEMSYNETLTAILNRDYNQISKWTKLTALYAISNDAEQVSEDLIALMFHPDQLIREMAGFVVFRLDRDRFGECLERLPAADKRGIEAIIRTSEYPDKFLKLLKLNTVPVFDIIHTRLYLDIEPFIQIRKFSEKKMIWTSLMGDNQNLIVVLEGSVTIESSNEVLKIFSPGEACGSILYNGQGESIKLSVEKEAAIALINKDKLFEMTGNDPAVISDYIVPINQSISVQENESIVARLN